MQCSAIRDSVKYYVQAMKIFPFFSTAIRETNVSVPSLSDSPKQVIDRQKLRKGATISRHEKADNAFLIALSPNVKFYSKISPFPDMSKAKRVILQELNFGHYPRKNYMIDTFLFIRLLN